MTWWVGMLDWDSYVIIRAERWFDARAVAWQLLNLNAHVSKGSRPGREEYEKGRVYEIRWEGSAANNTLERIVEKLPSKFYQCSKCGVEIHQSESHVIGGTLVHLVQVDRPGGPPAVTGCGPLAEKVEPKARRKR